MSLFRVYAPLSQFAWTGQNFTVAPGIEIKRLQDRPDLRGLDNRLADDEQRELSRVMHWFTFEWTAGDEPLPEEVVSLFLIALWLAQPTKAHAEVRFELCINAGAAPDRCSRLLDRFNWVPGATAHKLTDADLAQAAVLFPTLRDCCVARGRLRNALSLTLAGCMAHGWQVAFICHAAAAEAILTYDTGPGITRRLALAYACLVETSAVDRNRVFIEFRDLYSIRSDIMHGRAHNVAAIDQLPTLARFETVLRTLWRAVLTSPNLTKALEGTDAQREALFRSLQAGYSPPP